jgi:hypothetical protein
MATMTARLRACWWAPAAIVLALGVASCGEADGDDAEQTGTTGAGPSAPAAAPAAPQARTAAPRRARPRPLPGLPRYTAGFQRWDRLNDRPIPPDSAQTRRVGFDAHRGTKNVYVNRRRARMTRADGSQRFPYPDGTILVKAARNGAYIGLVAIMRKIQGTDPAHGDWEYVEYKRDGAGERFSTSASLTGATCWGCHGIAEDTDWVFTPLGP